jgi:hypothetical protein
VSGGRSAATVRRSFSTTASVIPPKLGLPTLERTTAAG